ncbi:very short patch repair endonuclease [Candidatus Aenigmatarchaeota archaeon]
MDVLSKEQRSYNMSRIRGKWTVPEKAIHNHLKGLKIKHKMHPKIEGNPDILLKNSKTLIFIDGCFWHKCPKCYKEPQSRRNFWIPKIEGNVKKGRTVTRKLRREGWNVIRIWEHEINNNPRKIVGNLICRIK